MRVWNRRYKPFSFDPNTQLPTGYTINVGSKAQTATITQNANHTMRQLAIADTIFSSENQICNFGYDEFTRLTSSNCGSVWGADYAYDIFGNMNKTMISGSPGTSFIPTYNTSNHYASLAAGTPSYDNDGNLLYDSFHHYTWDNEGNPVTIDSYSLTYDALSRRVEYGTGSSFTQYLYAPFDATLNLGAASAQASPSLRIPTPGGGQAILGASGITDYRRPNWQQSQPIDSSTTKTALSDASYTPYGEHYDENGYSGFFGGNLSIYPVFTDGYAATWRQYHYDQNRWISPDPAGLRAVDPSDPQTWNRYAYARGNPLGNIDPSGLCSDYDTSCFSIASVACPNWWNIWCWLSGSNGISPLPPSQYQASNAGVNPNSGNPGAPSYSVGGGSASPATSATSAPHYCAYQGSALSPQQYSARGKTLGTGITALGQAYAPDVAFSFALGTLYGEFSKGSALDAQPKASGTSLQRASYGNYTYGAFFAGAGVPLADALAAASLYGFKQQAVGGAYRNRTMDPTYSHLPAVNVQDITSGYNDALGGSLCHH